MKKFMPLVTVIVVCFALLITMMSTARRPELMPMPTLLPLPEPQPNPQPDEQEECSLVIDNDSGSIHVTIKRKNRK